MSANEHTREVEPDRRTPAFVAPDRWIYRGTGRPIQDIRVVDLLPPPPPWRDFGGAPPHDSSRYPRRPLLVTGKPGSGKSSLAYNVARELRLGRVLRWSVTGHSTLKSGLYEYDAIGRSQAAGLRHAVAASRRAEPASLDELDKRVCRSFPVVVITSNGEREFSAALVRRCLRLESRIEAATAERPAEDAQRGRAIPVSVLNLFPRRLWARHGLAVERVTLTVTTTLRSNRRWHFDLPVAFPLAFRLTTLLASVQSNLPIAQVIGDELVPDAHIEQGTDVFSGESQYSARAADGGSTWAASNFDFPEAVREQLLSCARRSEAARAVSGRHGLRLTEWCGRPTLASWFAHSTEWTASAMLRNRSSNRQRTRAARCPT